MIPLVSVIMANFNGAKFLPRAVASLQAQTQVSWELIVVDDASSDDSVAKVARAAEGDPRIRLLRQGANSGPAAARNRAIDVARGAWWAIVDSDDEMAPDRLARLVAAGERTGADIIADNLRVFSDVDPAGVAFVRGPWASAPRWISLAEFIDANRLYSPLPDLGYLKPLLRASTAAPTAVRYDESLRIGEDYDFLARLLARGLTFLFEPAALYFYRKHAGSISHRSRAADIAALLAANDRFERAAAPLSAPVAVAMRRRRRSLETMSAFDSVIGDLKAGRLASAAMRALSRPPTWPMLTRPIAARFARAFGRA